MALFNLAHPVGSLLKIIDIVIAVYSATLTNFTVILDIQLTIICLL